jgi:hypothetical protein
MAKPDWHYYWHRDLTVWMLFFAGTLGAIVAAMWMPVVLRTASTASAAGQELPFLLLFVLPACCMVLWAIAWWLATARRVLRMGRLVRTGVPIQASVEQMQVYRHEGSITGVALWLQYELDGVTYKIKKKTSWRRVIPPARDLKRIELAVDPESPKSAAFVIDGRLG